MAAEYSQKIAGSIREFLDHAEMDYRFLEDEGVFQFAMGVNSRLQVLNFFIRVYRAEYVVYARCPLAAKTEKEKVRMAEFITRANYGVKNGNFEMDFFDGEIRYKSYMFCGEDEADPGALCWNIEVPSRMYETYGEGILSMLFTDETPESAVAVCESREEEEEEEETADSDSSDREDILELARRIREKSQDSEN